ncbi:MAG TPA: amidohydrolase family protein [Candidatus Acidoferrales bacterium]|nr:amidohydrolase family protein [Candidatus Acidoferrales bacterium]
MSTAEAVSETPSVIAGEILISADSHIMEPPDLWEKRLPASLKERAMKFPPRRSVGAKPGGYDPHARLQEMAVDGVTAEVLYPTLGLRLFAMEDAEAQEACFRVANDWLIEYCSVAPGRLVGIPMISLYNIDNGIKEMERCKSAGLKGALIWQVPPPHLPFTSDYYDPFWAAAQDLDMPVNLHILTGFNYSRRLEQREGLEVYRASVNIKLADAANSLFDIVFSGVLERFPRLKIVLVENEIAWIPFFMHEWDKYYLRHKPQHPISLGKLPSEFVNKQVFATFFSDPTGGRLLDWWGTDTCMWSSDYPHAASTWPYSRQVIARELGHLPKHVLRKVLRENVIKLYDLKVPGVNA